MDAGPIISQTTKEIDDDEQATPGWLATLVAAAQQNPADVYYARVVSIYPEGTPDYMALPESNKRPTGTVHVMADIASKESQQLFARQQFTRAEKLLGSKTITRDEYEEKEARLKVADGHVLRQGAVLVFARNL